MRCSFGFLLLGSLYADLSLRICGWFLGIHHADITVVWSKWWLHISFMAIIRFKCMRWNIQVIIQLTYMYIHGLHIHIYIYTYIWMIHLLTRCLYWHIYASVIFTKNALNLDWPAITWTNTDLLIGREQIHFGAKYIRLWVEFIIQVFFFSNLLSHMWLAMCGHVCLDITVCKGVLHSYNSIEDWCINLSTHKCTCKARAVWWVWAQ